MLWSATLFSLAKGHPLVKTTTRMFGMAVAAATLVVLTSGRNLLAQDAPASDELKITAAITVADLFIAAADPGVTPGPGTERSALFAPGSGLPELIFPGALPTFIPPGLPGVHYVILSEPDAEPVDPNELPPVFFRGVPVSDLLINGMGVTSGAQPFIALISDNNPDLATYVNAIPADVPGVPTRTETGALQDLTPFLVPNFLPGIGMVDVQVQSDITTVPEPSALVLVALGVAPMLIARRRLSVR